MQEKQLIECEPIILSSGESEMQSVETLSDHANMVEKQLIECDLVILSSGESEMQSVETLRQRADTDYAERVQALNEEKERLLNQIFGCSHRHFSRPFARNNKTYRVCMSCGRLAGVILRRG